MQEYKELCRYQSLDIINQITPILDENEIDYKIEDTILSFDVTFSQNTANTQYILKVKNVDYELANNLFNSEKIIIDQDNHFFDSYSDEELIEAVREPQEWHIQDLEHAWQLLKKRNIDVTELKQEVDYSKMVDEIIRIIENQLKYGYKKQEVIEQELISKGYNRNAIIDAFRSFNSLSKDDQKKNYQGIFFGIFWMALGLSMSIYIENVLFYGAIIYGAYIFFKSISKL